MAEIIHSDGRTEFLEPPQGETKIGPPSKFDAYRIGRENVTAAPLKAVGVSPDIAKGVAQVLTPQTPAEQGIEAGTFMMPGVGKAAQFAERVLAKPVGQLAERGARYALPAIGGVAGDIAGHGVDLAHNLYEGAKGFALGAVGDVLPFAKGVLGRGKAIEKADERAVSKATEAAVPAFGKMENKADLDAVGVRGRGVAALDDFRTRLVDDISQRLATVRKALGSGARWGTTSPTTAGVSIDVPSLVKLNGGGSMTVSEAKGWLDFLGKQGWSPEDQLQTGLTADAARKLRGTAKKEIVAKLNAEDKGLGDAFDKGLNTLAKGHLYIDILRQPGVIKEGKLNMNTLRDVMTQPYDQMQTYGQRLEKVGTPEDVKAWYDALTRKSGDLTARDRPGSIGIGLHASTASLPGHIWMGVPKLPKHVGEIPPVRIGPGGTPIARGLMGLSQETAQSEQRE